MSQARPDATPGPTEAHQPQKDKYTMSQTYNDRRTAARAVNIVGWALTLIAVCCAIGAFALIIRNELARPAPITLATAQPTSAPAVRATDAAAAPATSAETLPIATPQANQPVQPPPAAVAPQFSPIDLGDVPAPTAQTTLSPEQYAASQASEELTFLNNANAGLTPAQRAVAEYNACVKAGGCAVVR